MTEPIELLSIALELNNAIDSMIESHHLTFDQSLALLVEAREITALRTKIDHHDEAEARAVELNEALSEVTEAMKNFGLPEKLFIDQYGQPSPMSKMTNTFEFVGDAVSNLAEIIELKGQ